MISALQKLDVKLCMPNTIVDSSGS